jgi:hypothetical protein
MASHLEEKAENLKWSYAYRELSLRAIEGGFTWGYCDWYGSQKIC